MPPIRTLVIGAFIGAIAYFALVNFMGSFLIGNHAPVPQNLAGYYNSLHLNDTNSSISILTLEASAMSTQLSNGNIVAGAGSAIGMVASFFTSLPRIIGSFINFTAYELAYIGIPTAMAQAASIGLIIVLIALGIVSAIFIFGI